METNTTKNSKLIAFVIPTNLPGMGGWGNGYVALPPSHPGYGKHYDHEVFNDISVHGGLTYADYPNRRHPEEVKGMWIVGFDTLHYGDHLNRWPDEASVMKEANDLKTQLEALH